MPDLDFPTIALRHRELEVLEVRLAARDAELAELLEQLDGAERKINSLYDLLADARDALAAQKQRS